MFKPTVHLNGTSRGELMAQQNQVMAAAKLLMDVMYNAMPHDRDYYPQHGPAGQKARDEWIEEIRKVSAIHAMSFDLLRGMERES